MTTEEITDAKAGWCGRCREGSHSLCMSGTCGCPDRRRHRNRPSHSNASSTPAPRKPAKPKKPGPIYRIARRDPPKPEPGGAPKLIDRVAGLLAEIETSGQWTASAWHSVIECQTGQGAGSLASRCRRLGLEGWEWSHGGNEVFVRRVLDDGADDETRQ